MQLRESSGLPLGVAVEPRVRAEVLARTAHTDHEVAWPTVCGVPPLQHEGTNEAALLGAGEDGGGGTPAEVAEVCRRRDRGGIESPRASFGASRPDRAQRPNDNSQPRRVQPMHVWRLTASLTAPIAHLRRAQRWHSRFVHFVREFRRDRVRAARAGATPRRQARRRQVAYLRRIRLPIAALGSLFVAVTAATFIFRAPRAVVFAVGVLDASLVWMLALVVIEASGATSWRMGSTGEEWTGEELKKLPRGWRYVHALPLHHRDVDHVVVGPSGVFALESKWSSKTWSKDDLKPGGRLQAAGYQAREGARQSRGRLRSYFRPLDVEAVVVVWGASELPDPAFAGTTPVIHGDHLLNWLRCREGESLDAEAIDGAVAGLVRCISEHQDEQEGASTRFEEVGAAGLATDAGVGLFGGMAGVIVASFAAALPSHEAVAFAVGALAASAGLLLRRSARPRLSIFGFGWIVGGAGAITAVAGVYAALRLAG